MNDGLDTRNTVTSSAASMNILTTDWQAEAERLRQALDGVRTTNAEAIRLLEERAAEMVALLKRFGLPDTTPPVIPFAEFGVSDVVAAMTALIPGFGLQGCQWIVQNDMWRVADRQDWDVYMTWDRLERTTYEVKWKNCTFFALALQDHVRTLYGSNCVGVVDDVGLVDAGMPFNHQFNAVLVTVNGKLQAGLVEPQDGLWQAKVGLYQVTRRSIVLL